MDIDPFAMQVSVYGALFTLIDTNRGGQHGRLDLLRGQEEGYIPFSVRGRHCNPGIPIRTLRQKRRFVSSALRFWSPLFIDAARSPTQIDTTSPPMGLQRTASKLRSGYVEGLWRRARYESPVRVRSFVTSSFKVHLPVDLWCSMERAGRGLGGLW